MRTVVNVNWFKNNTGVTETVSCVSTDSPLPDEINPDVHSITDKLSSVSLASEAHTDAIQTVLEQMATPVTNTSRTAAPIDESCVWIFSISVKTRRSN